MTDNERAFREAFDAHAPEPVPLDSAEWRILIGLAGIVVACLLVVLLAVWA